MKKNKLYHLILILLVIIAGAIGIYTSKYDFIKGLFNKDDVNKIYNTAKVSDCFNTKFSSLYLECDVATVSVLKGDEFSITYKCDTNSIPEVKFIDGNCWIKQTIKYTTAASECEINIIIPENTLLDDLSLNVSVGSVYVEYLKTDNISASLDVGSITTRYSSLGDSPSFTTNVGSIDIVESTCNNMNAHSSTGSITFDGCTASSIYGETEIGSISVLNSECDSYNLNTSLGDVSIDNHGFGKSYEK